MHKTRLSLVQWVPRLTRNRSVMSLNPIKDSCCFLGQKNFTLNKIVIVQYYLFPETNLSDFEIDFK